MTFSQLRREQEVESRYIRKHVVPWTDLFLPDDPSAQADDGAPTFELGAWRMSIMHFSDGQMEICEEDWATESAANPYAERGIWTGETYFSGFGEV